MEAVIAKRVKRTSISSAGSPLPDEIVEEILAWLPAKSVQRFRCVSRSWATTLSSPAFLDLHAQRAGAVHAKLFFKPHQLDAPFYSCRPPGPGGFGGSLAAAEEILSTADQFPGGSLVFPITKSIHGLVLLLAMDYFTYFVWNPSTGEVAALPDNPPTLDTMYGLGYCATSKRYKVARMFNVAAAGHHHQSGVMACEVFTLDESTFWRPAASQPPACLLRHNPIQGAVFCNGNLHFLQPDGLITTFNVSGETFGMLVPHPELYSPSLAMFNLTELDGGLCAFYGNTYPYHVWLLRDYEAQRWEKLRCVDWAAMTKEEGEQLRSNWMAPLGVYRDGSDQSKKIMFHTSSCKVLVADAATGIAKVLFSADECGSDSFYSSMGLFEESLMTVGRTSEEIMYSSPSTQTWSEILKWLPAHTLARLSLVCKEWRAMIKSSRFTSTHILHANSNTSPRVMFVDANMRDFVVMDSLMDADVPPLVGTGFGVVCSKPCHGLNVGSVAKYDFVCNPVTGYYNAVPILHDNDDTFFAGRTGMAFEAETDRHVLVRNVYKQRNPATRDYEMECHVHYVGDRSWVWDVIASPPRPVGDMPPAHVDGKLYWIVDPKLGPTPPPGSCEIMALDVTTYTFEVLRGPPCSSGREGEGRNSIVELGGAVCVACSHPSSNAIDVWTMREGGAWSLLFRVELARFSDDYSSEETALLAVDPRDGRILLSTGRALGYYDSRTSSLQTVYQLPTSCDKKFVPILCQESLVHPCDPKIN